MPIRPGSSTLGGMFSDLLALRGLPAPAELTVHEFPIPDVSPLAIARAAGDWSEVAYFHTAHDGAIVGLGCAWTARVEGERFVSASRSLAASGLPANARLLVGFSFEDDGTAAEEWNGFAPLVLSLPRVAVVHNDAGCRMIVALSPGEDPAALADLLEAMVGPGPVVAHSPSDLHVESHPSSSTYKSNVAEAVEAIRAGDLLKVVLARQLLISSDRTPAAFDIVEQLAGEHPGCYVYGWRRGDATFIGASPELLVALIDGRVRSVPFAGTAPRGRNGAEDTQIAARLLDSAKDQFEHTIMVEDIIGRLGPVTSSVTASDPAVERFRHVQHLVTHIEGSPVAGVNVLGLAGALHPTPAVGGVPLADALARIDKLETTSRGWYAGGIGWVSGDGDGEIAIALRCALLRGGVSRLYAGAGIVADSDPDLELEETRWKFRALHQHLGES